MRFCRAAIRADLSRDLTLPTNRLVPIVDAVQPLSAKTFAAAIRGKSLTSSATCAVSREVGSDGSRARRLSARHMQSSSSRLTPNLTVNQNGHLRCTVMMMPRARGAMTSTRLALLVPGQKPIDYSEHIMNMRLHAQAQRRAHSGRNRPDVSTPDSAVLSSCSSADSSRRRSATETFCRRGHQVECDEDRNYNVFCFAAKPRAERFMQELGGEPFDRRDRGGRKLDEWFNAKLRYGSDLLRDEHTLLHFLLGAGILYASSEFRATCIATRLIETGGQRPQLATR